MNDDKLKQVSGLFTKALEWRANLSADSVGEHFPDSSLLRLEELDSISRGANSFYRGMKSQRRVFRIGNVLVSNTFDEGDSYVPPEEKDPTPGETTEPEAAIDDLPPPIIERQQKPKAEAGDDS